MRSWISLSSSRRCSCDNVSRIAWAPESPTGETSLTTVDTFAPPPGPVGGVFVPGVGLEWVKEQRRNYARGTINAERQRRLQDVPGWTSWKASPCASFVSDLEKCDRSVLTGKYLR